MSDTNLTAGLPPIQLHAASYNLADLEAASKHAESLKTEEGRDNALAAIADKQVVDPEGEFATRNQVALPEGTKLGKVEDAQGNIVEAPVAIPSKTEDVTDPAAAGEEPKDPVGTASGASTEDTGNARRRTAAETTDRAQDSAQS